MYNLLYKKLNKNLFLLIAIWILFGCSSLYAQNNIGDNDTGFTGMVIDQYGNPLSGVEISIKKGGMKIVTDKDGIFSFDRKHGDVIIISHPSFLVQEFKLPKGTSLYKKVYKDGTEQEEPAFKVRLVEKQVKNPDTQDVLYGTVDKKSYLGSAATIFTNQMTTTLSSNIISSFAGRLPGLYTVQNKGMRSSMIDNNYDVDIFVGNRPKFNIGGYGDNSEFSINSRNTGVMVLVDGVQREFYSLDPEDIESVSIQKDALSSIGLGMRSSRSLLLITTKKPVDQGFQISLTAKFGIQKPLKKLKTLSSGQYAYLLNEALQNDGKPAVYTLQDYQAYRDKSSPYTHPDVDWYDEALKDQSSIQSYNLNASGGGKVAQYYVGLSYMDEKGLFPSSKTDNYETNARYQRYLITSRVNINVTNDFKVGVSLLGRIEDGNQPGATTSNILNNIFETPNNAYPIYNQDGSYGGNISFNNNSSNSNDWSNIKAQTTNSGYIKDNKRDGMASIRLDYDFGKLLKGLSARAQANVATQSVSAIIRSKSGLVYDYLPASNNYQYYGTLKTQENSYRSSGNYQQMYGQFGLNYTTSIGLHTIGGDIFGDVQEEVLNYDLPMRPANLNLKATYNYDMKYFAEAAVSRGYFNRYKPGKRWGTFFAMGLGWDISKENFLKDLSWVNQFKIRGVYGKTGNGVDNSGYYIWRQAYEDSGSYPLGYNRTTGGGVREVDDNLVNENISWEKANKLNIGTDISLFNNKLQITADYYNDKYYDLLQTRGKSIELIGLNYPNENIGKNRYKGYELSITYQDNIADFNYFVTANISRQESNVVFMDEQYVKEDYQRKTGRPVGVWMGYVADGFFQSKEEIANSAVLTGYDIQPGDIKYKDLNNDGVIDQYDQTIIGNDKPLTYFGLNLGFEYKGLEVSALVQGAYNRDIYLPDAGAAYVLPFMSKNQHYGQAYEIALNRWTPETAETATFPRLSAGIGTGFGLNSYNTSPGQNYNSFWVRSGNYIRLKNVSIAYTLPDSFTKNYLGGLRIKVFVNGQNLLTKSAYDDLDPEVLNFSNYPNLRGFNTGFNIKF
ncbi:MAG: SusC/RagA family TonB-linked outer membrane protein [Dysgonomonas sp.]|nr:SusC/RagA family TonB-linked outer membrane protein [Dysgonomonas sp.]